LGQWKEGETTTFLKEVAATNALIPSWVSLVNDGNSGYEVHIKPDVIDLSILRLIVQKHNLALKTVKGLLVVYMEHDGFQLPKIRKSQYPNTSSINNIN